MKQIVNQYLPIALLALVCLSGLNGSEGNHSKVSLKANYPMFPGAPATSPFMPPPTAGNYFQGYPSPMGPMPPQFGGPPPMMGVTPMGMPSGMMGGMPMGFGMPSGDPNAFDPEDPVTQALSLHQAGRYADAIQIYESINPPDPRIYASVADAHYRLGNLERALKYAVESLKLDPNYSSGHLLLGTILGEMGDMIRSIRSYERVIALDQNNPYAYYNLGLLYYKKSDIKAAIEYLERARDMNPNDPKIWNNLGVAYYDNNQLTKASAAYSQALALDPMYETAKRNLEMVRGKLPATAIAKKSTQSVKKRKAASNKKKAVKKK